MILHNIDLSVIPFQVWKSIKTRPTEMLPNYFTDKQMKRIVFRKSEGNNASITHQQFYTLSPNPLLTKHENTINKTGTKQKLAARHNDDYDDNGYSR